jgi:hypothetical protein
MSRSTVNRILIAYLIVIWGAVLTRCDQFPMTWAPMYTNYTPSPEISATIRDQEALERGILVTHRDGSTSYLTREDLNISKRSFWRIPYQWMYGTGPKYDEHSGNISAFNWWLRRLFVPSRESEPECHWCLFWSLNKTMGYEPNDSRFIVRIDAERERRVYNKEDLLRKDTTKVKIITEHATVEWQDEWLERWNNGKLF